MKAWIVLEEMVQYIINSKATFLNIIDNYKTFFSASQALLLLNLEAQEMRMMIRTFKPMMYRCE